MSGCQTGPACERCGGFAQVHITHPIGQEGPMHHLCLSCADQLEAWGLARERSRSSGATLMVAGAFTLVLSVFADHLGIGRASGFGWKQDVAIALGLVLVGAGALIRASTLLVLGGVVSAITALAVWVRLGGQPGFGVRQGTGAVLGLALMAGGMARIRWGVPGRLKTPPRAGVSLASPGPTATRPAQGGK